MKCFSYIVDDLIAFIKMNFDVLPCLGWTALLGFIKPAIQPSLVTIEHGLSDFLALGHDVASWIASSLPR